MTKVGILIADFLQHYHRETYNGLLKLRKNIRIQMILESLDLNKFE